MKRNESRCGYYRVATGKTAKRWPLEKIEDGKRLVLHSCEGCGQAKYFFADEPAPQPDRDGGE